MYRSRKIVHAPKKEKVEEESVALDNFHHYLMNSSLHGLKYIGDRKISLFERSFFALSFVIVSLLSGYFICNVWQKWSETPVIISLNPVGISLSHIPFPAVTICNMNQASLNSTNKISKDSLDFSLLNSMCGFGKEFNTTNTTNQSPGKWTHFRKFLLNVSQPCTEMLLECRFGAKKVRCMDIFWSTLTDDGLCCTFNTVHPDFMFHSALNENKWESDEVNTSKGVAIDWTPENGFPKDTPKDSFPRRVPAAGSNVGLTVVLNCDSSDYYCSSTNSAGFKILLHAPIETPKITNYGFFVAPGSESRVVVMPTVIEASQNIRRVSIWKRQCVFANEWNLSYFRTYTQKNCEMECESKTIADHCGCILYYMPKTTAEAEICSLKDAACYEEMKTLVKTSASLPCSCLPACHEIGYERRSSSSPLAPGNFYIKEQILKRYTKSYIKQNIAVVHIYFIDNTIHSHMKGELIGFTEFLSSTGGLLGLFMGFSVVSLIEILYYISMRPHCMKRNHKTPKTTHKVAPTFVAWKPNASSKRSFQKRSHQNGMHLYPYCE